MLITRDEARKHLLAGWPILYNGQLVQPNRRHDRRFAEPKMPNEAAGGEYVACRHATGFTRAGMVAIIRAGGGIMLHGRVIADEKELPAEEVLAQGDATVLRQLAAQQEDDLAKLLAQREETKRRLAEAETRATEPPRAPTPANEPRVRIIGSTATPGPLEEEAAKVPPKPQQPPKPPQQVPPKKG